MLLKKNTLILLIFVFFSASLLSLTTTKQALSDPDAEELIKAMEKAMGGWKKMYKLKDVQFTYNYEYIGQGKKDVSLEKYIFEGEHSWGKYTTHQINVMPDQEGEVIQSYVNNEIAVSHNGQLLEDEASKQSGVFLRKANYYWFTMMYKLRDPGVILRLNGTETLNGIKYQKVRVDFNASTVGKEKNDIYILYINTKTKLVDQFFFSLPARGINRPVILMKLVYKKINGVKVPYQRSIFQPDADGVYGADPNLIQTSLDIKFKNNFTPNDLLIK